MDNDTIQSSGENTLVTIWLEGKLRRISVSGEAIETFLRLPPGRPATTEEDRREFVRTHLGLVSAAARARLDIDASADALTIEAGELGSEPGGRAADRRTGGDRRKGDRRTVSRPVSNDRRRS
jgi:hypothetical protein